MQEICHNDNICSTIPTMDVREQARRLRHEGKSYKEIIHLLPAVVPKSTLAYWLRDVGLPDTYWERVRKNNLQHLTRIRKLAISILRKQQEERRHSIWNRNRFYQDHLTPEILKVALAFLYLGEGAKWKSHRGLMLGSSSPKIINLYIALLRTCYGISTERLRCRISHRADQDLSALNRYWSRVTRIPLRNFTRSRPDPRTRGKPTRDRSYKGVCVVACGGTDIQLELQAICDIMFFSLGARSLEEKR